MGLAHDGDPHDIGILLKLRILYEAQRKWTKLVQTLDVLVKL